MYNYFLILGSIAILGIGCEKDNNGNGLPPSLVIKATPVDSVNGLVNFEATAPNATGYDFDFGDGTTASSADGKISHTYTKIGTNTFYVVVSATGGGGVLQTKTR
ncbi:MAG TPA: PKD domain-containing protein, partial [Phnomibacter sp.]|nr:PKD domain-containing protein [Phnomibacter sp.]